MVSTKDADEGYKWNAEYHIKLLKGEVNCEGLPAGRALCLPEWFNEEKFRRGQKFFDDNYFSLFVSKLCGVLIILTVPEISTILTMTKMSSEGKTAFKRYLSTIGHMQLWYKGDIKDNSDWAFKSLKDIHQRHMAAHNRGLRENIGQVSQASLALTQFGFMGFALISPQKLGVAIKSNEEMEGFIHFWRTIGYMVGIQDSYNICRDSVEETKELCHKILNEIFNPVLKNPHEDFTNLSKALLEGMWAVIPQINVNAFLAFTNYVAGIEVERCKSLYSRFMYNFQIFVHETLLGSKWFGTMWRKFLNFHMWFTLIATMKLPLLAYFAFGVPLKNMEVKY